MISHRFLSKCKCVLNILSYFTDDLITVDNNPFPAIPKNWNNTNDMKTKFGSDSDVRGKTKNDGSGASIDPLKLGYFVSFGVLLLVIIVVSIGVVMVIRKWRSGQSEAGTTSIKTLESSPPSSPSYLSYKNWLTTGQYKPNGGLH